MTESIAETVHKLEKKIRDISWTAYDEGPTRPRPQLHATFLHWAGAWQWRVEQLAADGRLIAIAHSVSLNEALDMILEDPRR